ncbi:hypothetical protein KKQ11_00310 [Pseudomonas sp. MG-2]|uniref:hypothetical protein n=1 Tax=Pseudomonas sp. MG-2 TaxID=405714 RepID=UPI001C0038DB|nr:hypothetical protein [Pseudomonas sp. MG-2]MBT9234264.1 hypothetical protein [Pseudomonas sp. MG-2]
MVRALKAHKARAFADSTHNLVALSLKLFSKVGKFAVARISSRDMEGHIDALGPANNIDCDCTNLLRGRRNSMFFEGLGQPLGVVVGP